MNNITTERAGIAAVIAYETAAGRTQCVRVSKCGYDLKTTKLDGTDERHIEVKATQKKKFTRRWLEQFEHDALIAHTNFYLYLVTDAVSKQPKVREYTRQELRAHFIKQEIKYLYSFPAGDF